MKLYWRSRTGGGGGEEWGGSGGERGGGRVQGGMPSFAFYCCDSAMTKSNPGEGLFQLTV